MTALSRRSLLGLGSAAAPAHAWVRVARASACSPGTVLGVALDGTLFRLESLAEGIRVVGPSGAGAALELRTDDLFACAAMPWPRTRVLTHATGEPRDFDDLD